MVHVRLLDFMIPIQLLSTRIITVGVISIASVFLTGLFLYQVQAQPLITAFNNGGAVTSSKNKIYLSGQAAAGAALASTTKSAPVLEIHIANNGIILLRGARIVSITGGALQVDMAWGAADFTWLLNTNTNTKFIASNGEKETLADLQTGSTVTVTGQLVGSGGEPTIDAEFVRE